MSDYIKAWQCIGCGRIEGPQTCIGICQDRKVQLVYAEEHQETLSELDAAHERVDELEAMLRRLACTNPRNDGWENSYREMQAAARALLARDGRRIETSIRA